MRNALLIAVLLIITSLTSAAQSAKPTAPPPNWIEQWSGNYANQDQPGREAPPGYKVLNPFSSLDEVIIPLLQPWAAARREETDFELEEDGQVLSTYRAVTGSSEPRVSVGCVSRQDHVDRTRNTYWSDPQNLSES